MGIGQGERKRKSEREERDTFVHFKDNFEQIMKFREQSTSYNERVYIS